MNYNSIKVTNRNGFRSVRNSDIPSTCSYRKRAAARAIAARTGTPSEQVYLNLNATTNSRGDKVYTVRNSALS